MLHFDRILVLRVLVVIAFLALAGKMWQLQIVEGDKYRSLENRNSVRMQTVNAPRGVIYDRNMNLLVGNKPSWVVSIVPADLPEDEQQRESVFNLLESIIGTSDVVGVIPNDVPPANEEGVIAELSRVLQMPPEDIRTILSDNRAAEIPIEVKSGVPPDQVSVLRSEVGSLPGLVVESKVRFLVDQGESDPFTPVVVQSNLEREKALIIDVNNLKLPGVVLGEEPVRQYADGAMFSQVIGYVGRIDRQEYEASKQQAGDDPTTAYDPNDIVGKTGVESTYEDVLRGKKGGETVLVGPNQRVIQVLNSVSPVPGNNLVLSIDSELQRVATDALQKGMKAASDGLGVPVESGVAVAMNPKTGEVYAMVSLPSYDNNLFAEGISVQDFQKIQSDPNNPMVNKAVSGLYPPGSTFKIFTASAALQEGVINATSTFNCPGRIDVVNTWGTGTTPFYCWDRAGHGPLNVIQALAQSCDVFFYNVAGPSGGTPDQQLRYFEPGSGQPHVFQGLGIDKMNTYATQFGLAGKTGVDLPGELEGLIPGPDWKAANFPGDIWTLGDTLNTGIGQGYDLVTPLELL
ncbi:MAG: penicillin-binding transpeptidase domain-containing protein, partial [Chloroflexi bacterium]|nr:penicillin-binding transpeptidase domain-containing protein [Chloroflexota bacterium]